jgi:hypothetical protein
MRTKIFIGLSCCVIFAASENSYPHRMAENHESAPLMSKLTIEQVQEKYQNQLLSVSGVVGVGIGAVDGKPVIKVLVVKKTPELEWKIPKVLEGYPVMIEVTGKMRAL